MILRTFLPLLGLLGPLYVHSQTILPQKNTYLPFNTPDIRVSVFEHLPEPMRGAWHIDRLALVSGGRATVVDGHVVFQPAPQFKGAAFIYYTLKDTFDQVQEGILRIDVGSADPFETTASTYFTTQNQSVMLMMPPSVQLLSVSVGQCTQAVGSNRVYAYTPPLGFTGTAELVFEAAGVAKTVAIVVLPDRPTPMVVTQPTDKVGKGDTVVYDFRRIAPWQGDSLRQFSVQALATTAEKWAVVASDTLGKVFFVAKTADTEGVACFEAWGQTDTVRVVQLHLAVGPHLPDAAVYTFNVLKNSTHFWAYPIGAALGGRWTLARAPVQGSLEVADSGLYYTPWAASAATQDSCWVTYCAASGACRTIQLQIRLWDTAQVPVGVARSAAGIWPGDTNQDGQVESQDIGALAADLAHYSPARVGVPAAFFPFEGSRAADADGDGFVSADDTALVAQFWGQKSTILPQNPIFEAQESIELASEMATLTPGMALNLDVALGAAEHPVRDIHHLTFTVLFNPRQLEASSLATEWGADSWLTQNKPYLAYIRRQPQAQTVVVATLHRRKSSGYGRVARVRGIVIDDINGFSTAARRTVRLVLSDIKIGYADGSIRQLPPQTYEWPLAKPQETRPFAPEDVQIYPNPSHDFFNLYVSGDNHFKTLRVRDVWGRDQALIETEAAKQYQINAHNWPSGLYFLTINTTQGSITKKIQVIH